MPTATARPLVREKSQPPATRERANSARRKGRAGDSLKRWAAATLPVTTRKVMTPQRVSPGPCSMDPPSASRLRGGKAPDHAAQHGFQILDVAVRIARKGLRLMLLGAAQQVFHALAPGGGDAHIDRKSVA